MKSKNLLNYYYDQEADILYISLRQPQKNKSVGFSSQNYDN